MKPVDFLEAMASVNEKYTDASAAVPHAAAAGSGGTRRALLSSAAAVVLLISAALTIGLISASLAGVLPGRIIPGHGDPGSPDPTPGSVTSEDSSSEAPENTDPSPVETTVSGDEQSGTEAVEPEITTFPETEPETSPATEPETVSVTEPETVPVTEPETAPATEPVTQPVTAPETMPEITTPSGHTHTLVLDPKQEAADRWYYDGKCGGKQMVTYYCTTCNQKLYSENGVFEHRFNAKGYCVYCLAVADDRLAAEGLTYTVNPDGKTVTLTGMSASCKYTDIVIPAELGGRQVTAVAPEAFLGNKSITSVTFLGYVAGGSFRIDNNPYQSSAGYNTYQNLDGIVTIGARAFAGCTSLASVSLLSSLTGIGSGAFEGDKRLDFDMRLTPKLATVGQRAFAGCLMKTVDLTGTAVTDIPAGAFAGAGTVSFKAGSSSLKTIGDGAFENCTQLSEVTLPSKMTGIGSRAFAGCVNLPSSLKCPSSASVAEDAFSVTPVERREFNDPGTGLACLLNNLKITVTGRGVSAAADVVIPAEIDGYPVEMVDGFTGDATITSLTVEEGVVQIRSNAFMNCPNLTKIILPESLNTVGYKCFSDCGNLVTVIIKNDYTFVSDSAFENCPGYMTKYDAGGAAYRLNPDGKSYRVYKINLSRVNVTVASSVNGLPVTRVSGDLGGMKDSGRQTPVNVSTVYLPDSISEIGPYAFYRFNSLQSVRLPEGLAEIPASCFEECKKLTSVEIPSTVISIGGSAFERSGIESTVLPSGLVSIGPCAFETSKLQSAVIPDSVTSLGAFAFSNCSQLTSVSLGSGIRLIDTYTFYQCTSLESVVIPSCVSEIGEKAFCGCSNLKDVVLPGGISVAENAFEGTQFLPD
ncbi:MAG: leucine-rich repeat protein [Clostridia bacterium]|nr:leucine-rich repeat protein [Clostridia bacterium]